MTLTKVFRSGNSQAVRIPKKFQFRSRQVQISRHGEEVVLREQPGNLAEAFDLLSGLSADFFKGDRRQPKLDKRAKF